MNCECATVDGFSRALPCRNWNAPFMRWNCATQIVSRSPIWDDVDEIATLLRPWMPVPPPLPSPILARSEKPLELATLEVLRDVMLHAGAGEAEIRAQIEVDAQWLRLSNRWSQWVFAGEGARRYPAAKRSMHLLAEEWHVAPRWLAADNSRRLYTDSVTLNVAPEEAIGPPPSTPDFTTLGLTVGPNWQQMQPNSFPQYGSQLTAPARNRILRLQSGGFAPTHLGRQRTQRRKRKRGWA